MVKDNAVLDGRGGQASEARVIGGDLVLVSEASERTRVINQSWERNDVCSDTVSVMYI